MKKSNFAVISGTGVTEKFKLSRKLYVETIYGMVELYKEKRDGYLILPRHGPKHSIPPHLINYRANILALSKLGVKYVIATNAVGSMREDFPVGSIGTAEQFIDLTKRREPSIYSDRVFHTDMTKPYSEMLNKMIKKAGRDSGVVIHNGLVYACTEGPRYETPAEIRMLRKLGADVVGMTGVPEVVYAKELSIEYSSIVVSTNWAAGMQEKLTHEEVLNVMKRTGSSVRKIIDMVYERLKRGK
jgi:5'-methylthioadenosine phosphorylase